MDGKIPALPNPSLFQDGYLRIQSVETANSYVPLCNFFLAHSLIIRSLPWFLKGRVLRFECTARVARLILDLLIVPRIGDVPEVKARSWTVFGKGQREDLDEEDAEIYSKR